MVDLSIPLALSSAAAYSTDVVLAKLALDEMPMFMFLFILSGIYLFLGIIILVWKGREIRAFFQNKQKTQFIGVAIFGVLIGTLLADTLMWAAIQKSKKSNLPLTITLIHTTPIFSLFLVMWYYKVGINLHSILGLLLAVTGCGIMIYHGQLY